MEEPVWKERDLHLVERESRPVIDISYVELPERLTYRIFNTSNIFGTAALLAMIAATGAGDNLLLGLLFTAIFAGCPLYGCGKEKSMEKLDFVTLEAAMARDWLNLQIKCHDMQEASCAFNDSVRMIPPDSDIHMDCGIVYITDLLGLKLEEEARDDAWYPWRYSFMYGGARFYQISDERLGEYAAAADV
ncbi:MAG: hypothetical protein HFH84_19560 [Lachnospiraceae bacterium]|nr:hypothetical protein [Lachnospiraceae bacterium]